MASSRSTDNGPAPFSTKTANGQLFAGVYNGEIKGWEEEADAIDYLNRDEAEYLLGNHVSNGKPVKPVDKQVRDLLVTHLSKISVPALN